jgi:hypothetical protein
MHDRTGSDLRHRNERKVVRKIVSVTGNEQHVGGAAPAARLRPTSRWSPTLVRTDDSKYFPRNEIFENVPISDYAFAIHEPFDLTRKPVSVSFVD